MLLRDGSTARQSNFQNAEPVYPKSPVTTLKGAEANLASLLTEVQRDDVAAQCAPVRLRRDVRKALRWYVPADIVALVLSFVGAWGVASLIDGMLFGRSIDLLDESGIMRLAQFLVIAAGVVLWFHHTGHYSVRMPFWLEGKKIVGTLMFATVIDGFLQFASKQDASRLWLMSAWAVAALGIVVLRIVLRGAMRRRGAWQVPTLLVGAGVTAQEARAALQSEPGLGYEITAQVKDLPDAFLQAGRSWEALCARHDVDYIVVALDGAELGRAGQPLSQLTREAVPFAVAPPLGNLPVLGMMPQYFFNHNIMLLARRSGLEQPLPRFIKRSFDIVASGVALLALSPLFLSLALLVRLDGGSALFPNRRVGMDGKRFGCLKFRSMVPESDKVLRQYLNVAGPAVREEWHLYKKLRGEDPRVTRIGRLLRKTSLDELPQLLNVLKGDMSLVGPRPILPSELDEYDNDIAHYYRVRPGITGLWQVSGRNEVTYAQRVQMDSWYVRNWSLWHDIVILCKTVPVLLKRRGAY